MNLQQTEVESITTASPAASDLRKRPVIVVVMEPFSYVAGTRAWLDLEEFFNPQGAFSEVHIVSVTDDHPYETTRYGSLYIYPVKSRLNGKVFRVARNIVAMLEAERLVRRLVRARDARMVVHTFGGPLKYGLPAVVGARRTGVPSVISLHSDYPVASSWTYSAPMRVAGGFIWRYLFDTCTAVRSVSSQIAQFAFDHGVTREQVAVIPNKENLERFRTPPAPRDMTSVVRDLELDCTDGKVVFLTVGRLIRAKNIDGMLRAFAKVTASRPNVVYIIAGDGPEETRLCTLAADLEISDKVKFVGFVDHERLRVIYHTSDVFLFATHYEGQPRTVVEAMLCHLPVICSDRGQVCDIVQNGIDGLWVDPLSQEALVAAIESLASNEDLRERMSRHSDFDETQYSLETVGKREIEFLFSVLDRS